MLPRNAREIVEEIAGDRRSGALSLAQRAVEAYEELEKVASPFEASQELHEALRTAQPWMVAVANASILAGHLVRAERLEALGTLRSQLGGAQEAVGREGQKALTNASTLLTLSRSGAVLEILTQRHEAGDGQVVYVCESRPLQEGVSLARTLQSHGIAATVLADAAGPTVIPECDAVLLGADSLLRDLHVVNKVGTLSLALASREFGVPCYIAMEVLKVELEGNEVPLEEERRDPEELAEGVSVRNFYFERVPAQLFAPMITDAGVLDPQGLTQRFRTAEALMAAYGLPPRL